jgi:hypothetical protein
MIVGQLRECHSSTMLIRLSESAIKVVIEFIHKSFRRGMRKSTRVSKNTLSRLEVYLYDVRIKSLISLIIKYNIFYMSVSDECVIYMNMYIYIYIYIYSIFSENIER